MSRRALHELRGAALPFAIAAVLLAGTSVALASTPAGAATSAMPPAHGERRGER